MKISLGHPLKSKVQRRYHGGNGDRINNLEIQFRQRKQIARQYAPFINGACPHSRQTPVRRERFAVKNAERSIRVSNVDYQKHKHVRRDLPLHAGLKLALDGQGLPQPLQTYGGAESSNITRSHDSHLPVGSFYSQRSIAL